MSTERSSFGSLVFGDAAMKQYLAPEVYEKIQKTIKNGKHLDTDIANDVADGMKNWAIEKGATHFTHWFQPLNGVTAEKHDSFICTTADGDVIYKFSGRELIKGEGDASSLPSGGLRATFEARGYTAWDATSYAFVKGRVLCIPTAFCSYDGSSLDNKTPLLRSMEKISKAALRVLKLFGNGKTSCVRTTVGAEQEYFLIPEELFVKRKDLIYTGRTLFGARPPKGQELDDHYYGSIKPRVASFMTDVNNELWALGVPAKTEHNEAAPAQHELAPIFTTSNIAADQNQLTMEILKNVARRHGLVCLLHEKPFDGVNGSGKHNNWSMSTDDGVNLLEPGETPAENAQFLLFLTAIVSAVDEYPELIRISVAGAGNDHRLGGNEAPPAIISVFLGDEITGVLDAIEENRPYSSHEKELLRVGVHTMPKIPRDTTDRNRTSPIAFTGNKFEFRIPGAPASISSVNTVINTTVASKLNEYADILEGSDNFADDLHQLIRDEISAHRRIIFNGNCYSAQWREEAEKRGLSNLPSTPEALAHMLDEKNVRLFTEMGIFTRAELVSRREIMLENYCKLICIEGLTMVDMARRQIIPAVNSFRRSLIPAETAYEREISLKLASLSDKAFSLVKKLERNVEGARALSPQDGADYCLNDVIPVMNELRSVCDGAELLTPESFWPFPNYGDLMFGI